MELLEKLRRLRPGGAVTGSAPAASVPDAAASLPAAAASVPAAAASVPAAAAASSAAVAVLAPMGTGAGIEVRRTVFPLGYQHGTRALGEVARVGAPLVGALCGVGAWGEAAAGDVLARARFFDVETTSAGGGAGVYVFLVGVGGIEGDAFAVDQVFLRAPSDERALLEAVAARLGGAPALVSYAGRGFDERRLADRYAMARLPSPFSPERPHLDLLPVTRAIFGARLPATRLRDVESARLGLASARDGDLPGAACPDAYFRFLQGDPRAPIEAVFRHNLLDVLSLVTLLVEVEDRARKSRDAAELLGLGLHWRRRGCPERALASLLAAESAAESLTTEERRDLALALGRALRRAGRRAEATRRFRAVAEGPLPSLEALVELAKEAEHLSGDLTSAEAFTLAALALARRDPAPRSRDFRSSAPDRRLAALDARLARLCSKRARLAAQGPWLFDAFDIHTQ